MTYNFVNIGGDKEKASVILDNDSYSAKINMTYNILGIIVFVFLYYNLSYVLIYLHITYFVFVFF